MEMNLALVVSGGLLGVAAIPHCAVMCSAPCAAIVGRSGRARRRNWGFHGGRAAGYAAAGALAAIGVGAIASLGRDLSALRPMWVLLHAAAMAFGLWLLLRGRAPEWISSIGRAPNAAAIRGGERIVRWDAARAGAAGVLWVGWPCGVLQAALGVAALSSEPLAGAATMLAFAGASSAGLWIGPSVWRHVGGERVRPWAARIAGAMLAGASAWALLRTAAPGVAAWCGA